MSRLIISSPDGKKGILELNKPVITIGRGNANDLVLNDSSVSRFHAVVKLRDNAVVIADRGSTNGVVLGGKKIAQETEMQNGDIAVLGLYELRLEHVDEKGIFVRKAEFPSTINQLIRGGAVGSTSPPDIQDIDIKESASGLADLVARLKRLESNCNSVLQQLCDLRNERGGTHSRSLRFRATILGRNARARRDHFLGRLRSQMAKSGFPSAFKCG